MALLTGSYPNLVNGVSQQDSALRLPSQSDFEINTYPSIAYGNGKRPFTRHRKKLTSSDWSDAFVHEVNRSGEQILVLVHGSTIKVFDPDGNEKIVQTPDGTGYLSTGSQTAADSYRAISTEQYTLIANRTKSPAMSASLSASPTPRAIIWIKSAPVSQTYKVNIDGVEQASYTTGTGSPKTDTVATNLETQLVANLGANWSITRQNNVLLIRRVNGADFNISAHDTWGDQAMSMVKDSVQSFNDLPTRAVDGMKVLIRGTPTSQADEYWVEFIVNDGSGTLGPGVWVESNAPGIVYRIDAATMPHRLDRTVDSTGAVTGTPGGIYYVFRKATWGDRETGTVETNKNPSFISNPIRDMFLFQDRLGLVTSRTVVMSEASNLFTFFRKSVATSLDTDPIDVQAPPSASTSMESAEPFNQSLIIFGPKAQIVLKHGEVLANSTVSLKIASQEECIAHVKPRSSGAGLFFATPRGAFSGVKELFVHEQADIEDTADITGHVPRFIEGTATHLAVATNESFMALQTTAKKNLWCYRWYWDGERRIQSAWTRWTFTGDVVAARFLVDTLYLVVRYPDGTYLESLELLADQADDGTNYLTYLDRRIDESKTTVSYDPVTDKTTFSLPYPAAGVTVVTRFDPSQPDEAPGVVQTADSVTGNDLVLLGNWTGKPLYFGLGYTKRYRFSRPLIRNQAGRPMLTGRLQLQKFLVRYSDTGYFKVRVQHHRSGKVYEYVFTGRVLGSDRNIIGKTAIEEGVFRFPVRASSDGLSIEVINDSPFPDHLLLAEWEGSYTANHRGG